MMLTLDGVPGLTSHTRVNVMSCTTSSEPSPSVQSEEFNGDDLNSSILSYSSEFPIAICRLFTFVLMAKENIVATATNPQVVINEVINISMSVNPRLRMKTVGRGGRNQIRTKSKESQL
jgi:hypothetical protein